MEQKITKANKKLLIQGLGLFILTIGLVPILQGLACLICIMVEL